jgi:hypothetical protein
MFASSSGYGGLDRVTGGRRAGPLGRGLDRGARPGPGVPIGDGDRSDTATRSGPSTVAFAASPCSHQYVGGQHGVGQIRPDRAVTLQPYQWSFRPPGNGSSPARS